ncbi:MAG: TlpA disulfide reductase family protein [Nitrospirota bacterium]
MRSSLNRSQESGAGGRKKAGFAAACVLSAVFWLLAPAVVAAPPDPFDIDKLIGKQAPEFTLKDMGGIPVSLSSMKGSVVLLNFWATWCPPCRAEIPSMNKLGDRLKGKKFVILGVTTDRDASSVRTFMKRQPIHFPVLLDTKLRVSKETYKVSTVPMTFLIDKRGVIIDTFFGEHDWTDPDIIKQIEALL